MAVFAGLLGVLWAVVCLLNGGFAFGDNPGTPGPLGAAIGLTGLAALAAAAVWTAWGRADTTGRIVAGLAVVWLALNAVSITWSADPSLAWLATNRAAMLAASIALGVALAALGNGRARRAFTPCLTIAAAVPVAAAVAHVALPALLSDDGTDARLAYPVGHPNVLALVAALALPGALQGIRVRGVVRADRFLLAVGTAAVVVVTLSLSRGGLAAAGVACLSTVATVPRARQAVARLVAVTLAAAPAAAFGLLSHGLSADGLAVSQRQGPGLVFAALLVAGCLASAPLARLLVPLVPRPGRRRLLARRAGLVAALLLAVLPAAFFAAGPDVRDCTHTAVIATDVTRVTDLQGNQRGAWWCEAGRGFTRAPVVGNGAGSFPQVELLTRTTAQDTFLTRDPHGIWVETASALGVAGLALLAALWVVAAVGLWRRRGAAAGAVGAVLLAVFAQAQTDWVFSWPAVLIPAGVAMGLAVGGPRAVPRRAAAGPATAAALAAVCVVAAGAGWLPYLSERAQVAGEDALAARDAARAYRLSERASTFNPLALDPLLLRGEALEAAGQPDRAIEAYRRATRRFPDNADSWRWLAQATSRARGRRAAKPAWEQVVRLDPNDPEALRGVLW